MLQKRTYIIAGFIEIVRFFEYPTCQILNDGVSEIITIMCIPYGIIIFQENKKTTSVYARHIILLLL